MYIRIYVVVVQSTLEWVGFQFVEDCDIAYICSVAVSTTAALIIHPYNLV